MTNCNSSTSQCIIVLHSMHKLYMIKCLSVSLTQDHHHQFILTSINWQNQKPVYAVVREHIQSIIITYVEYASGWESSCTRVMVRAWLSWIKPGFTARVDGWPVSITCQHGPCKLGPSTRVVETGLNSGQVFHTHASITTSIIWSHSGLPNTAPPFGSSMCTFTFLNYQILRLQAQHTVLRYMYASLHFKMKTILRRDQLSTHIRKLHGLKHS